MEDHEFVLNSKGLGRCTRMAFLAHLIALLVLSGLVGYTIVSKSNREQDFEYMHGVLLELQAKANLLSRDSIRSLSYWQKRNKTMTDLNYNNVEMNCKQVSSKKSESTAPVFADEYLAFKKHFDGAMGYFMGNTGYSFEDPSVFNQNMQIMGIEEENSRPDYSKVKIHVPNGKVEFCYVAWGEPDEN